MIYSDLKGHAAQLGRFASIREGAPAPSDRILVQAYDGELKFVAGCDYDESSASLIVKAGPTNTNGKALVNARTFLSAAKSLRGKGEIDFEITPTGCTMRTNEGGEIMLGNVDTRMPDILPPRANAEPYVAPKGFLDQAARLLGATTSMAVSAWRQVGLEVKADALYLRGGDSFMYTSLEIPQASDRDVYGSLSPEFLDAVRTFDGETSLIVGETQLVVEQGPYKATTSYMERFPRLPMPPKTALPDTYMKMPRKAFLEAVKTLTDEKVSLNVTPRDAVLAGWPELTTSLTLKADTYGRGRMAVMRDRLAKLASAFTGDTITVAWNSEETGPARLWGESAVCFLATIPLME